MKTKIKISFLLLIGILLTIYPEISIAKNVKIDVKKSSIVISGTSTIHDWKTKVLNFKGDVEVEMGANSQIETFKTVNLYFFCSSFSSGKSSMDKKTKEAVKADKHPLITFTLDKIKDIKSLPNKQMIIVSGKVSIAGVTKNIEITAWGTVNAAGEIVIEAKKDLEMKDFGIEPPEVLFVKAGNKIEVRLTLYLS